MHVGGCGAQRGKTERIRNKKQYSGEPWPKSTATSWWASPLVRRSLASPTQTESAYSPLPGNPHSRAQLSIINYYCSLIVALRYAPPLQAKNYLFLGLPSPLASCPPGYLRAWSFPTESRIRHYLATLNRASHGNKKKHSCRFHFCSVGYD